MPSDDTPRNIREVNYVLNSIKEDLSELKEDVEEIQKSVVKLMGIVFTAIIGPIIVGIILTFVVKSRQDINVELWMPSAVKHDLGDHAPCDQNYQPKAVAHITWDKNAAVNKPLELVPFVDLITYFAKNHTIAPHLLWNPFDGNIVQFFPADSRSMSLVDNSGGTRTNRAGKVVIQIEALFFPYCIWKNKVYAKLTDTPCKNWDKIQEWTTSLGVSNRWPMGKPNGGSQRNEKIWETNGGWYGHSQIPENSHTDPLTWPDFIRIDGTTPATPTKPIGVKVPKFPGTSYFKLNARNSYVTQIDKNLIRLKFTKHNDGNGYQAGPEYTTYTRDNVRDFQHSRGWTGSDADGFVGPQTWHDLFTL